MPRPRAKIPELKRGPRDSARVWIVDRYVYLGTYGTPEAEERYRAVLADYLATGAAGSKIARRTHTLDVADLADRYIAHVEATYTKRGAPTSHAARERRALELLYRSGNARGVAPADFGPRRLRAFRDWLAADPAGRWSRTTINAYAATVVRLFSWAVSEELTPEPVAAALERVEPIKRGRSAAELREPRDVAGVPDDTFDATIAVLERTAPAVAAMARVQRLAGMRPGEVAAMRPADLDDAGADVRAYRVPDDVNKAAHAGRRRVVFLGPRALEILRPYLDACPHPDAFVFSPARALADAKRAARSTPAKSHRDRAKRPKPPRGAGDRYTVNSYRQAVRRACARAFPHPTLDAKPETALTPAERDELDRWRRDHRWSPNQLRHAAASALYNAEGLTLEQAAALLGHADARTSRTYAKSDHSVELELARRYG